ncbi:hypothetical protein [Streptomyces hainanensis]|uniref:DUF1508 domain-containing protein n=1 Tax=Streptomyces hainanensis TaxID=402648 RepID=A0A4R4TFY0_9ACTN|nr:hypothetical protein [Streptomyces hainanensis]TDC74514.1 hypothetical protein E1283_15445 [Streptomyces hainanensis]
MVAVSAESYPDHDGCRAAFDEVCRLAAELADTIQHTHDGAGWTWHARTSDGRRVARSARAYERHATCQSAAARFRLLLAGHVAAGQRTG